MPGEDLALTILTGRRPGYLKETVRCLLQEAPAVAHSAHVTLMVNGKDPETLAFVKGLRWVDDLRVLPGPEVVPIGPATSELYEAAKQSQRPLWLHLEDDWACSSDGWLDRARSILNGDRTVGQVRLRHVSEPVLHYHMVTRKRIKWAPRGRYRIGTAHYTFNPSLVRTSDAARVFPCSGEPEAMRKFLKTKLRTAQLLPGAFRHLGESSLRVSLGRAH